MHGNFEELYEKILIGPEYPEEDFIVSGYSFKEIYDLAAGLTYQCNCNDIHSICLCTENKAYIAAALLASAGGGASVILPYSFNDDVIKEIYNLVGFDSVFTDISEIRSYGIDVIMPSGIKPLGSGILRPCLPDSVFIKIFTGGSTGKPKVWEKTLKNIFSEVFYHSHAFEITKKDIFVSSVPPQHIYGLLYSILVPFVSSAKVIGRTCLYPQEILSAIIDNSASILVSIPMHYRILKAGSFDLPSLRLALSSGGSLDFPDAMHFYKQTGIEIAEIFGSTETGGIAIRYNSGKDKPWRIFNNIEWKVGTGKLCVRSEFISQDLLKDADGYYITEDRVEVKDGNSFNYLGRADGIVKVAGKRVDLKKVEDRLKKINGVADAVVVSMHSPGGRKNIIAAVIEGCADKPTIMKSVKDLLEPYELPRKIKIIDKIPVTSTGKYDRQKILALIHNEH